MRDYFDDYYEQIYQEANKAYNNFMILYYLIPIVVIALVFGFIALHLAITTSKTRKKQFAINQHAMDYLYQIGFTFTSVFYFCDQATFRKSNEYKKMLAVDNVNKQFALVNYNNGHTIVADYSEFLNYEIYENSNMVMTGGAIGGFGLGFFGATQSGQCKDLRLIMRLTRPDTPHVAYDVLPRTFLNIGVHKNSKAYRDCLASLQEMVSFFEVIKNQNENANQYANQYNNQYGNQY